MFARPISFAGWVGEFWWRLSGDRWAERIVLVFHGHNFGCVSIMCASTWRGGEIGGWMDVMSWTGICILIWYVHCLYIQLIRRFQWFSFTWSDPSIIIMCLCLFFWSPSRLSAAQILCVIFVTSLKLGENKHDGMRRKGLHSHFPRLAPPLLKLCNCLPHTAQSSAEFLPQKRRLAFLAKRHLITSLSTLHILLPPSRSTKKKPEPRKDYHFNSPSQQSYVQNMNVMSWVQTLVHPRHSNTIINHNPQLNVWFSRLCIWFKSLPSIRYS